MGNLKIYTNANKYFIDATKNSNIIQCNGITCILNESIDSNDSVVYEIDGTDPRKKRKIFCDDKGCIVKGFLFLKEI